MLKAIGIDTNVSNMGKIELEPTKYCTICMKNLAVVSVDVMGDFGPTFLSICKPCYDEYYNQTYQ